VSRLHLRSFRSYLDRTEEVQQDIDGTSFEDEVRLSRSDLSDCSARTVYISHPSRTVTPSCVDVDPLPYGDPPMTL
jgi:hypothetical protein